MKKPKWTENNLRLALVEHIGGFLVEWNERPRYGKGSDCSDLVRNLARRLIYRMKNRDKVNRGEVNGRQTTKETS